MNATKKLLLLTALALPGAAFANEEGHIDGYYIPSSKISVDTHTGSLGSFDLDGDGFGGKGMIPFGRSENFFLNGEYQAAKQDADVASQHFKDDVDQIRFGAGWQVPLATGTGAVYAEYVDIKQKQTIEAISGFSRTKIDADGVGIHARLAFPVVPGVNLYGQIGYLSLQAEDNVDVTGPEYLVGASIDFTPDIGAFVDYRQSNLKYAYGNPDEDDTLKDLRVGVRILFGRNSYYR